MDFFWYVLSQNFAWKLVVRTIISRCTMTVHIWSMTKNCQRKEYVRKQTSYAKPQVINNDDYFIVSILCETLITLSYTASIRCYFVRYKLKWLQPRTMERRPNSVRQLRFHILRKLNIIIKVINIQYIHFVAPLKRIAQW